MSRYTDDAHYFPEDHYWLVDGTEGIYSSKSDSFVSDVPDDFPGVVTKIASADELREVLQRAGIRSALLRPVPQSVTMAQARIALQMTGKLAMVQAGLEALKEPERTKAMTAWEYAPTVSRTGALVQTLSGQFGMSEADLDDLFILAGDINL